MRGIDVTPEQLESAKQFICDRNKPPLSLQIPDDRVVQLRFSELACLVAWYGAMRYMAGAAGINSLEKPGELESVNREVQP